MRRVLRTFYRSLAKHLEFASFAFRNLSSLLTLWDRILLFHLLWKMLLLLKPGIHQWEIMHQQIFRLQSFHHCILIYKFRQKSYILFVSGVVTMIVVVSPFDNHYVCWICSLCFHNYSKMLKYCLSALIPTLTMKSIIPETSRVILSVSLNCFRIADAASLAVYVDRSLVVT